MSQIQTAVKKPQTIGQLLEAQMSAIAMVVAGSTPRERMKRAEKFARICLTAVRNTPHLSECSMPSLAAAIMTSAQLDLEPNTPQGLAYLIPYKGKKGYEAQFQIGYKGLLQLAYRSGMVQSINADIVYRAEIEAGLFSYAKGACPNIIHETDLLGDYRKGEIVAAYAACTLKGGQTIMRVIDRQDVERAQKTSASFKAARSCNKPDMSPWYTNPEAMWMKTAIKRLAAWMPQAEILSMAVEEDSKADREALAASAKSETEAINDALAATAVVPLPQAQEEDDNDAIETSAAPSPQPQETAPERKPRMTQEELDALRQQALNAVLERGYDRGKAEWLAGRSMDAWTATDCKRVLREAQKLHLQEPPAPDSTQAGSADAAPGPEAVQEQTFVPPYQTFACPHNDAQITEEDCYDCKHRTGCPHWEAAPAADA